MSTTKVNSASRRRKKPRVVIAVAAAATALAGGVLFTTTASAAATYNVIVQGSLIPAGAGSASVWTNDTTDRCVKLQSGVDASTGISASEGEMVYFRLSRDSECSANSQGNIGGYGPETGLAGDTYMLKVQF